MSFGKVEFHHDDNRVNIAGAMSRKLGQREAILLGSARVVECIVNHSLSI